jgi:hypothetical protein
MRLAGAASCVACASLLAAGAGAQSGAAGPASRPASAAASRSTAQDSGNLLLRGWLKELLDRDPVGARADYELARRRDEASGEFARNMAIARIAEIDAFVGPAARAIDAKKELKAVWSEMPGDDPPHIAPIRDVLASLSPAADAGSTQPTVAEGREQVLARLRKELSFNRAGARPYLETLYESFLQLSGMGRGRRGGPGPMRGGGRPGRDPMDNPPPHDTRADRENLRRQFVELLGYRVRGDKDAAATRLEGVLLQRAQSGAFGPSVSSQVRWVLESDPKEVAASLLSQLEHYLQANQGRTGEPHALLEQCREKGKALIDQGEHVKARELLFCAWPIVRF